MRKRFFSIVLCALTVLLLLSFSSCDKNEEAEVTEKSLTVLTKHEGDYVLSENIDLSEITCTLLYSNGEEKTIVVDDGMLSEQDRNKFLTKGTHTVTIYYGTLSCRLQISVVEKPTTEVYHATFYSLGGTQISSQTVTTMQAFPVPEREGYIFDGWYTDINYSGAKLREPYTLNADTDFYAKWIDNRVCSVHVYAATYVELPLPIGWDSIAPSDKPLVGDIFKGYEYDGDVVTKQVFLRGSSEVKLSVPKAFSSTPEVDRLVVGDMIYKYNTLLDGTVDGITVARENVLITAETVHYGEKYGVSALEFPETDSDGHKILIEGKHFVNWNVTNGDADEVKVDLVIRANFQTEKCTVTVYYFNSNDEEISVNETYNYGEVFTYSDYKMPTKEGYTSRWVVYYNHEKVYACNQCDYTLEVDKTDKTECPVCGGRLVEQNFEEVDGTERMVLTHSHTLLQANHVVNTFKIYVRNAKQEQTNEALKYSEFSWDNSEFEVEWNTGFDYTQYTQSPKLDTPANISEGYSSLWCYVIKDAKDNEYYYNGFGQLWDEEAEDFVEPAERPLGEGQTNWVLRDYQGNYIARVRDGILTEIRASVNMYAKYLKKDRTVMFRREYNNVKGLVAQFIVPFYEDFSAYDPFAYVDTATYAISPDRQSDGAPSPDSVIRKKMAIYEQVRLYELYLLQEQYEAWKNAGVNNEQIAAFLWLKANREEWQRIMEMMYGADKASLDSRIKNAFKAVYPTVVESDVKTFWEEYDKIDLTKPAEINSFYNMYQSRIRDYGFTYESVFVDDFDVFQTVEEKDECENAYFYYKNSAGYLFYTAQINRNGIIDDYEHAVLYKRYLDDPTNPDLEENMRYRNEYFLYFETADFLFYYAGLEGAESEERRIVRLGQVSEQDIESFYLFTDTNQDLRRYSTFYTAKENEDWSLVWYKNSEKTADSLVSFKNHIEIKDDITYYCSDVDNRRYQLTFQYGYSFEDNKYKTATYTCGGSEEIVLDATVTASIYRTVNGTKVEYKFLGWFDTPYYSYLTTGYRNEAMKLTGTHSENIVYYAHYYTEQTFTVKIYDATQATAYTGREGFEDGYAVEENTILYEIPAGSLFSVENLYKGTTNSSGGSLFSSVVNGQRYYNQKRFLEYFESYYENGTGITGLYQYLSDTYTKAGKTLEQSLSEIADAYKNVKTEYTEVMSAIKNHDYAQFSEAEYVHYLTEFTKFRTKNGDIYSEITDWRAFICYYLDVIEDIYAQDFADISDLTDGYIDGILSQPRYKRTDIDKAKKDEWNLYYRNYYVFDGNDYVPASNVYDGGATYYTFLVTTDYEFYYMVSAILNQYLTFVRLYETEKSLYETYLTQPMHTYFDSMNDINRANNYDYEGAGDIKYNFIGWYEDANYTKVFLPNTITSNEYVDATQEALLDSLTWDQVYDDYYSFNKTTYSFVTAPYTYSDAETYYQKDDKSYYQTSELAKTVFDDGKWEQCKDLFYVFTMETGSAKYKKAGAYSAENVYYTHYKNVTSVIESCLLGWSVNYTQYYVKSVTGEYLPAIDTFDVNQTYYKSNAMNLSFYVQADTVLYAKWMDISRGTEGLVYEMVCEEGSDEIAGYVVIDLVNRTQSERYKNIDTVYITANDNNTIPQTVVADGKKLELQFPASIDGYGKATITPDIVDDWENMYEEYYVFNKTGYYYEPADRNYNSAVTYYDKYDKKTYPVIGVKKEALQRYSQYIYIVNLPLNLDFIEEGAFDLCPIERITRAKARAGETAKNTVIIDDNNDYTMGVAIYQQEDCGVVYVSKNDASVRYTSTTPKTIITYAVNTDLNKGKSYTLLDGTVRIGEHAFSHANIDSVTYQTDEVSSTLQTIGAYGFDNSKISKFTVAHTVTEIGEKAFNQCIDLSNFVLMNNSLLRKVGANALYGTDFYKSQKALVCLEWTDTQGGQTATKKILLSFNPNTGDGYQNYDKDEVTTQLYYYNQAITYDAGTSDYTPSSTAAESFVKDAAGEYVIVYSDDTEDYIAYRYKKDEYSQRDTIVLGGDYVAIADNAFEKIAIKRVIINAKYLEEIGSSVFSNSVSLEEIWFMEATGSVDIGEGVFDGKMDDTLTIIDPSGLVRNGENWSLYDNVIQ